eukprot:6517104-Prorocentrum_lima.AAC.1
MLRRGETTMEALSTELMSWLHSNATCSVSQPHRPEVSGELFALIQRRQQAWRDGAPEYVSAELTRLIRSTRKAEKKREMWASVKKDLDIRD